MAEFRSSPTPVRNTGATFSKPSHNRHISSDRLNLLFCRASYVATLFLYPYSPRYPSHKALCPEGYIPGVFSRGALRIVRLDEIRIDCLADNSRGDRVVLF